MSLSWEIAIGAAIIWTLGTWIFLKTVGWVGRDVGQDERAMKEAMMFSWSEARILEVMDRFPNSPGPALVYAGKAIEQKDFVAAANRYRLAIDRNRRDIAGYLGAERALREGGLLDEAEAMLRLARRRFPRDRRVLADLAWIAHARKDWPAAVRRWETLRKRFPMDKNGYIQGAEALRKAGRIADADTLVAAAAARFPEPAAAATAGG